ncbi:MAG TPA: HepT-like ribonuclease domain-containing protein [Thermoanaerobaculia bacterium]
MIRHDDEYLAYAARAIEDVCEWTNAGPEQFYDDVRTQAAVLYRLQTLTEALLKLTPERRRRYPDVPFHAMRGFRNVIAHDFLGLNLSVVWGIVAVHVPVLRPQVARMLADL